MNTIKAIFWINYIIMSLSTYIFTSHYINNTNPHWTTIIALIISFLTVAIYQIYLSYIERYISRALTSAICAGLFLVMAHLATSPLEKLLTCVLSMFCFLGVGYILCKIIESSNWFKNYKDKNNQLIEQENIGPEPDPKDFENS
jgi:uncharacterized protein YacL